MIDLNEMSRAALETAKAREQKGQLKSDTFSILKHCAGETCETALLRVQEKNKRRAE